MVHWDQQWPIMHHASMLAHVMVPHIQKWKLFPAWVIDGYCHFTVQINVPKDSNRSDRLPYEEKKYTY